MSVKIELNEHSANDVAAINELRKLGFDDEEIQDMYNKSHKICGRCLDNQKKPETGFVNKVCVHFRDGNGEQDSIYMNATDVVLDNPEYLIFTTNDHKQIYFNKKDVVYFEMWGDQG